ncbi:MAG: hypothetical protein CMD76_02730 [Gammaproteobacteria bacterium]|nr:hypothetical protein [Gammaproteobacteria bacterium]|tara:strand:+ start:2334 stop:2885 length:552 start_codon:yes stop_codon:yes gene_type:complete
MQTIDPDYFFITPEVIPEDYLDLLESIKIKKELLLLRCLDNSELNKNLNKFLLLKKKYQTKLILSSRHLDISERFDGIHFNSVDLMNLSDVESSQNYLGASCHNEEEINKANQLKLDYIFVSPVKKTKSHQDASSLGWHKFKELRSLTEIKTYALGGMRLSDLDEAKKYSADGIAGISTFMDQ